MPYVNKPRPWKREYALQKQRGDAEHERRMARQRARRELDKEGIDRTDKVIDHKTPLSKGGTNAKSNLKLTTRAKNASFSRNSDHSVKKNTPKKKG